MGDLGGALPPKRAKIAHSPTRAGDTGMANASHGRLGFIEESLLRHTDDPPPGILEQFASLDVVLPAVGIAVSGALVLDRDPEVWVGEIRVQHDCAARD